LKGELQIAQLRNYKLFHFFMRRMLPAAPAELL
jgi:hypothetical protein